MQLDATRFPYLVDIDTGRLYFVDESGAVYQWHADTAAGSGLGELGGFWSVLGQIGAAASFAIPGVGPIIGPAVAAATGLIGQHAAQSDQIRQLGQQWDTAAGQAAQLLGSIQAQPRVTFDDVARAEAAVSQLAEVAAQPGLEWIASQWNTGAYKPAFDHNLKIIRDRAAVEDAPVSLTGSLTGALASALTGAPAGATSTAGGLPAWAIPAAVVVGAVLLLR